jgi:hypothetical protein
MCPPILLSEFRNNCDAAGPAWRRRNAAHAACWTWPGRPRKWMKTSGGAESPAQAESPMALNFWNGPANLRTECAYDGGFLCGAANPGRRRVSTRRQAGLKAGCGQDCPPHKLRESTTCQTGSKVKWHWALGLRGALSPALAVPVTHRSQPFSSGSVAASTMSNTRRPAAFVFAGPHRAEHETVNQ